MASRRLALLGGSALAALTLAAGPVRAADECGVVGVGGTATCNALSYPDGIAYPVEGVTVNVGAAAGQAGAVTISTAANLDPGVLVGGFVGFVGGHLTANVTGDVTIDTAGDNAHGINVHTNPGMGMGSATVVSDADITTTGNTANGILAHINGFGGLSSVTSTGAIVTRGTQSTGIAVSGTHAAVNASGSVTTHGDDAVGIAANAGAGDLDFTSSATVRTYGTEAHGIDISAVFTGVATISGNVTTSGADAAALYIGTDAQSMTVTVSGDLTTSGATAYGTWVRAFLGTVAVTLEGTATTTTDGSHGLLADHTYYDFTGNVSGSIITSGAGADGILSGNAFGAEADTFLTVGAGGLIRVTGAGSNAIRVFQNCDDYIIPGCSSSSITVSGSAEAENAGGFGIAVFGTSNAYGANDSNIVITGPGVVAGGSGAGGGIDLQLPQATVSISGQVSALSDLAIRGGGGIADIDNSGMVIGRLDLGGGADRFDNAAAGAWYARGGDSDFGDGADTLTNLGLISVIGDQSWFGIETLLNDGRLSLQEADAGAFNSHPGSFETLTVAGGFGGVGRLALDTYLGDETSLSDVVVIQGAVGGTTLVEIANAGGPGAATAGSGIRVIDVSQGTTDGDDFLLAGPVMAGAFEYDLVLEPDGIWYLQSAAVASEMLTPYVAPQLVALTGWHLQTGALHERLGEVRDQLRAPGAQTAALGRDDLQQASAFGGYGGGVHQGFWLRALEAGLELEPDGSLPIEQSSSGLQGGYDLGWRDSIRSGDLLLVGGSLGFGSHRGELRGADSEVELFGPTLGAYATWLAGGLHVDLVARADLLDAHLAAPLSGTDDSTRLTTVGGSIEVGYRAELGGLYLEPQIQLAYAHSWSGDLEDGSGTAIELDGAGSLRGRVGARVGGPLELGGWQVKPYLEANLHHEFLGEAEVTVTGVTATSDLGGSFGSVGGGFETEALGEHLSLYLDVDYLFGENTRGVAGIVGARIAW